MLFRKFYGKIKKMKRIIYRYANEFNKVGNHNSEDYNYHYIGKLYNTIKIIERETGKNVTDKNGNGDYGLSKKHFAETICNERPNFNDLIFIIQ